MLEPTFMDWMMPVAFFVAGAIYHMPALRSGMRYLGAHPIIPGLVAMAYLLYETVASDSGWRGWPLLIALFASELFMIVGVVRGVYDNPKTGHMAWKE